MKALRKLMTSALVLGCATVVKASPAIVDPGNPVGTAKTVSAKGVSDSGGDNPLSGYTIIRAESIHQAFELEKICLIIGDGSI